MSIRESVMRAASRPLGRLSQLQKHHDPVRRVTPGMPELLRSAAAQGAVLLENSVLPLKPGTKVSVFGRTQLDWFCTGYGSGGDVNAPYRRNLLRALRACDELRVNEDLAQEYEIWTDLHEPDPAAWGMWPTSHPEMEVTEELMDQARASSEQAIVVIGRASGEDRENLLEPGSYYLTREEKELLKAVTEWFPQAVLVLNIGSVMDLSFLDEYSFGAVLLAWQGGMESGNAVADLLCGRENPSGRLTDTIARCYGDYPSSGHFGGKQKNLYYEDIFVGYRYFETFRKVCRYPFGYGLSYTTFAREPEQIAPLQWRVTVTNTGGCAGREAVLLFVQKPGAPLWNPSRELVAFGKTDLLQPGQSQSLMLTVTRYQLSSFDDSGLTGHRNCYVLQAGTYHFYCGGDVRQAQPAGAYCQEDHQVLKTLTEAAAPAEPFNVLTPQGPRAASLRQTDLRQRIREHLPKSLPLTADQGLKLGDVKKGITDLDAFIAQLSITELEAISRGGYTMDNPLGARGNAGILGGVTPSLRKKGIPPITTTDGPSGIRLYASCSLLPIGTLLACTFDVGLVERVYAAVGAEMKTKGSHVLLAPGMNLHRDPLCGRNFEYFSEDPYLTGRMAAAVVKGIQSQGLAACPKHFACNNQEKHRTIHNSVVTQRALREVYLKGFEICVKLASPKCLMTSYNKINGVWGHYHYDLVQTILRGEWGYDGLVITDWWMRYAASPEFPKLTGNAYRIRSGVDVLMPGNRFNNDPFKRPDGTLLKTYEKPDGITLGELQRAARHVLEFILKLG